MSKKTKPSTSRPSVLPIRKTRGKAKGPRKGETSADGDQPTIPMETPATDAVETPTATAAPETTPAPPEAPPAKIESHTTPTEPTAAAQPPTAETPPEVKKNRKGKKQPKPQKMSALNAAAKVQADAGTPMNCQEMIDAMAKAKLWSALPRNVSTRCGTLPRCCPTPRPRRLTLMLCVRLEPWPNW